VCVCVCVVDDDDVFLIVQCSFMTDSIAWSAGVGICKGTILRFFALQG